MYQEASYLSMAFHGTVAKSEGYMAELCKWMLMNMVYTVT